MKIRAIVVWMLGEPFDISNYYIIYCSYLKMIGGGKGNNKLFGEESYFSVFFSYYPSIYTFI